MTSKRNIWITGASSGIGEALCFEYAEQGCNLIVSARREEKLKELKERLTQFDVEVIVQSLDIADTTSHQKIVDEVIVKVGRIDEVLHNAGISQRAFAIETDLEVDRKIMDVNYFGTISLTKALLPHFIEKKGGKIGVTTSVTGMYSSPYRTAYAASKHALHGFFDGLRAEHVQDNIQVTLICPGFVRTNIANNALTGKGEKLNKMDDAQANGMNPGDVASKIYKAMQSGKNEIYMGGLKEVSGIYVKRFFPALFAKVLSKVKVR